MTGIRVPQFSLRALLGATTLCALGGGYLHWTGRDALALAAATTLVLTFATVPLAFAASVAIDGWRTTASRWQGVMNRWKLPLALGCVAMMTLWIVNLAAIWIARANQIIVN